MKCLLSGTILIVVALTVIPTAVSAQQKAPYDLTYLTSLYQSELKRTKPDPYVEQLIAQERSRIRRQMDQEVLALTTQNEQKDEQGTATKPIDVERSLVTSLQDEIRDRQVDLDLLNAEEQKYYLNPASGTGAQELRLTKTHQELLARTALSEERIAAFRAGLTLQQDRLSKLTAQARFEQFATLINTLTYAAIFVGAVVVDRLIRRQLLHRIEQKTRRYVLSKIVSIVIYVIAIVWIFTKLFSEHPGTAGYLAIVGAGLAVAMQDIVKDIVAWFIILQRRLFTLGNRVTIGDHTGDIIDIGLLRTTMLEVSTAGLFNAHERTGKTLYLPNSIVLREPVLNYHTTSDFMNVEMKVTITYESDWKKAEEILRDILHRETLPFVERARRQEDRRTALFYGGSGPGEPDVDTDIVDSGVLFTLSFTVPIGKRRSTVTKITRDILDQFKAAGIGIAYSTVRVVGKDS